MNPKTSLAWLAGVALVVCAQLAQAAPLVPPPGFFTQVRHSEKEGRECPPRPEPYTGKLNFPSKFQGSDKGRDDLNERAYKRYKEMIEPINYTEKHISALVNEYLDRGDEDTLQCTLDWLLAWSRAGALKNRTDNHTGRSVRKWTLASLSSAWLRLKFSESQPLRDRATEVKEIEAWFADLGRLVIDDWKDQPLKKMNNHEYWAAWAVMATAVALDRRDWFEWSLAQYRIGASQVDGEGFLPNELRRQSRALAYHNYALNPLAMIAAFAKANGVDVARENRSALQRLAYRVVRGLGDPESFEERAGEEQNLEDLDSASKFAWLEPYCWTVGCDEEMTERRDDLRPIKTYRLGGNVTELFAAGTTTARRQTQERSSLDARRRTYLPGKLQSISHSKGGTRAWMPPTNF